VRDSRHYRDFVTLRGSALCPEARLPTADPAAAQRPRGTRWGTASPSTVALPPPPAFRRDGVVAVGTSWHRHAEGTPSRLVFRLSLAILAISQRSLWIRPGERRGVARRSATGRRAATTPRSSVASMRSSLILPHRRRRGCA
jgi:hypothetical protein